MNYLIGALIFAAGYFACFFTVRKPQSKGTTSEKETVMVPRRKPSFSNPMRTYKTEASPYERNKKGLYEPRKPKADKRDEVTT